MISSARSIYMDYNASAPLLPAVKGSMISLLEMVGNSSSVHSHGRAMRSYVDSARREILSNFCAQGAKLIFTGSATESNNMALRGVKAKSYIVSSIEHPSVFQARGDLYHIPVGRDGIVNLEALEALLKELPTPALVSVMLVNNETGVIQPIKEVARIAHAYGAIVHTDAVQAVGRIPLSFHDLDVDIMTIAAHKFGGPMGISAVIYKDAIELSPLILGGGHEQGLRAGTQNVALIEGMRVAIEEACRASEDLEPLKLLRDQMESQIRELCPESRAIGGESKRIHNTSCLFMPGVSAEVQLMAFDLAGISVSSGSACSSGKVRSSHVMEAMGVDVAQTGGVLRISLGWNTKKQDVDAFVQTWAQIYKSNLRESQ